MPDVRGLRLTRPPLDSVSDFRHCRAGRSGFALAAEVGVELFEHGYMLVETAVCTVAFLDDRTDAALLAKLGFAVPF
jgi:hypothetical protein